MDAVLLLTSELVTNAVRHARSAFEVVVEVAGPTVRVVVLDRDVDHRPELQSPGPNDTNGRGLLIVDRLASGWGTFEVAPGHKAVWFSVG